MIRRIRVGNAMLCLLSYTLRVVGMAGFEPA